MNPAMINAVFFLGNLQGELAWREVPWEEFRQAWTDATLRTDPGAHYACGPHATGFYFHDGLQVAGTCYMNGGLPGVVPTGHDSPTPE